MQTKRLELQFINTSGKKVTIIVPDPKDNLISDDIAAVMNQIVISNIFNSSGGDLVNIAGARVVTRDVNDLLTA